jgi:hypothetical protein
MINEESTRHHASSVPTHVVDEPQENINKIRAHLGTGDVPRLAAAERSMGFTLGYVAMVKPTFIRQMFIIQNVHTIRLYRYVRRLHIAYASLRSTIS